MHLHYYLNFYIEKQQRPEIQLVSTPAVAFEFARSPRAQTQRTCQTDDALSAHRKRSERQETGRPADVSQTSCLTALLEAVDLYHQVSLVEDHVQRDDLLHGLVFSVPSSS